jgi:hypothetical protein
MSGMLLGDYILVSPGLRFATLTLRRDEPETGSALIARLLPRPA